MTKITIKKRKYCCYKIKEDEETKRRLGKRNSKSTEKKEKEINSK